jgi:hypothetical protein
MDKIYRITIEEVVYNAERKYDDTIQIYSQRVVGDIDVFSIINAVNKAKKEEILGE